MKKYKYRRAFKLSLSQNVAFSDDIITDYSISKLGELSLDIGCCTIYNRYIKNTGIEGENIQYHRINIRDEEI